MLLQLEDRSIKMAIKFVSMCCIDSHCRVDNLEEAYLKHLEKDAAHMITSSELDADDGAAVAVVGDDLPPPAIDPFSTAGSVLPDDTVAKPEDLVETFKEMEDVDQKITAALETGIEHCTESMVPHVEATAVNQAWKLEAHPSEDDKDLVAAPNDGIGGVAALYGTFMDLLLMVVSVGDSVVVW